MSTIYNNGWTLSSDIAAGDSRLHPGCCCVPSRYQAHERSLALRLRLGAVVSFLHGRSPKRALGVLRRDQRRLSASHDYFVKSAASTFVGLTAHTSIPTQRCCLLFF
jgi:hypothetical protein